MCFVNANKNDGLRNRHHGDGGTGDAMGTSLQKSHALHLHFAHEVSGRLEHQLPHDSYSASFGKVLLHAMRAEGIAEDAGRSFSGTLAPMLIRGDVDDVKRARRRRLLHGLERLNLA